MGHNHIGKHNKHIILMLICCLIPIAGIVILIRYGIVGSWGYYGLILLCPLGHFIMMFLMNHRSETHQRHKNIEIEERGH